MESLDVRCHLSATPDLPWSRDVYGTPGNDVIVIRADARRPSKIVITINGVGTKVDRHIASQSGQLSVNAGGGNDKVTIDPGLGRVSGHLLLEGSEGNDLLIGTGAEMWGGEGNDTLVGGNRSDTLDGGIGDDLITGGRGDDFLNGESGRDTLDGQGGNDELIGGSDDDLLRGGVGNDTLYGDGLSEVPIRKREKVYQPPAGHDTLYGEGGDDGLYGGPLDDLLNGGAGNDTLRGSGGIDTLSGGGGANVFTPDADDKVVG